MKNRKLTIAQLQKNLQTCISLGVKAQQAAKDRSPQEPDKSDMNRTYKFRQGGIWDGKEFVIERNCRCGRRLTYEDCPHCKTAEDGKSFVVPRIVIAQTVLHTSTGVCLDCILEAAKTIDEVVVKSKGGDDED